MRLLLHLPRALWTSLASSWGSRTQALILRLLVCILNVTWSLKRFLSRSLLPQVYVIAMTSNLAILVASSPNFYSNATSGAAPRPWLAHMLSLLASSARCAFCPAANGRSVRGGTWCFLGEYSMYFYSRFQQDLRGREASDSATSQPEILIAPNYPVASGNYCRNSV